MTTGLTAEDRDRIRDLVTAVARAGDLETFVDLVLEGVLELVPTTLVVAYNEIDPSCRRFVFRMLPDPGDELHSWGVPLFERTMLQNPLVRHFHETGDTRAMMWSDLATTAELEATELYRELFAAFGITAQLAVTLPAPPGIVVAVVCSAVRPFSERDRTVLNMLRPHLASAYSLVRFRRPAEPYRTVLASDGWLTLLVDGEGRVLDPMGEGVAIAREAGIEVTAGAPLPEPVLSAFRRHVAGYRSGQVAAPSEPVRLETGGGSRLSAWVVPSPVVPHLVLVRTDTAMRRRLAERGLTPRQVDVAVALADGRTNIQIAAELGMAAGTVKKHLERIYAVLGVDNRAAAVATIHRGG